MLRLLVRKSKTSKIVNIPKVICDMLDIDFGDRIVIEKFHVIKEAGGNIRRITMSTWKGSRTGVYKRLVKLFVPQCVQRSMHAWIREKERERRSD